MLKVYKNFFYNLLFIYLDPKPHCYPSLSLETNHLNAFHLYYNRATKHYSPLNHFFISEKYLNSINLFDGSYSCNLISDVNNSIRDSHPDVIIEDDIISVFSVLDESVEKKSFTSSSDSDSESVIENVVSKKLNTSVTLLDTSFVKKSSASFANVSAADRSKQYGFEMKLVTTRMMRKGNTVEAKKLQCTICNTTFDNKNDTIKSHASSSKHIRLVNQKIKLVYVVLYFVYILFRQRKTKV